MAGALVLSKILRLRESEKQEAQQIFEQSTRSFEDIATNFYQLLRQKESAEHAYNLYLTEPARIGTIKEQLYYIERLNEQITALQQRVQQARQQMEKDQDRLFNAHVEVKKYKTIIDHRKNSFNQQLLAEDKKNMDEASVQQYLKNR